VTTADKKARGVTAKKPKPRQTHSNPYKGDDTPRAFTRLLSLGNNGGRVRSGLDNGDSKRTQGKKRKRSDKNSTEVDNPEKKKSPDKPMQSIEPTKEKDPENGAALKIQPGERLAEFAARVDQALPISGLTKKGKKVEGGRERVTKHEKKLRRLQDGWRKEEARIKEKEEEEREEAEDEWDEKIAGLDKEARKLMTTMADTGGRGRKKKKQLLIGEVKEDEDPWAVLEQTRDAPKGLHDVVEAPPVFKKLPREVFKGARVGDIPKNSGSLRRREELMQTRKEIISQYRSIMAESKRSA
jgi:hypothetical protein